jgi:hypothetical protein
MLQGGTLKRGILTLGFMGVALVFAHAFALALPFMLAGAAAAAGLGWVLAGIGPSGPPAENLHRGEGTNTIHTPAHGTGDGDSGGSRGE